MGYQRRSILAAKLLQVLLERAGTRGRCTADLSSLIWSIKVRWPRSPRPSLWQVEAAVELLVEQNKLKMAAPWFGGENKVFIVTNRAMKKSRVHEVLADYPGSEETLQEMRQRHVKMAQLQQKAGLMYFSSKKRDKAGGQNCTESDISPEALDGQ